VLLLSALAAVWSWVTTSDLALADNGSQRTSAADTTETVETAASGFYALQSRTLEGEEIALSAWQGQVALVVNVASKCGLTPQYAGLEKLYRELAPRGFVILAFPSNDFSNQEPGTPAEIRQFCTIKYEVTFPLFEKVQVRGEQKCEIYRFLTQDHEEPTWNFTKYLVSRDGRVVARFDPRTKPDAADLRKAIEQELLANLPE
jgi:glutathione peroxidase